MAYAIFGDSYVTRLEKFTRGDLRFRHPCRLPGMTTRHKFEAEFDRLCSDRSRYVFLILGGNDINRLCSPARLFQDIRNVVLELKTCGVERVFVCSILPRGKFHVHSGIAENEFNRIRKSVNERLKKELKQDYVDTGKWLKYPTHYNRDMVHPGGQEGGLLKLRHAIVTAFGKTIPKSVVRLPASMHFTTNHLRLPKSHSP